MVGMPLASGTEVAQAQGVQIEQDPVRACESGVQAEVDLLGFEAKSRLRATSFSPASIIVAAAVKGQKKGTLFSCCASLGRDSVVVFMRFAP